MEAIENSDIFDGVDLKSLNLNKLEENKLGKSSNLSSSEKFVLENQSKYIKLHEEENVCEDITQQLFSLSEKLKLGQMIHTQDFTLEETMNSVELDHYKMDSHYNFKNALTYKVLLREGKIKSIDKLNYEEVRL